MTHVWSLKSSHICHHFIEKLWRLFFGKNFKIEMEKYLSGSESCRDNFTFQNKQKCGSVSVCDLHVNRNMFMFVKEGELGGSGLNRQ